MLQNALLALAAMIFVATLFGAGKAIGKILERRVSTLDRSSSENVGYRLGKVAAPMVPANPELIPALILLLLAAFATWPYNFYIFTRIIVCPTLIYIAVLIHRRRWILWEISLAIFALIFNPIARFHFRRETWAVFNILTAISIAPALYVYLKRRSKASLEILK